jgi:clan AA aspartic protease
MMTGTVANLRPLILITLRLVGQPDLWIEFVIDTGFTGALALPLAAVSRLGLPYIEDMTASLANDTSVTVPVHAATIVWHGREQLVRVLAVGRRPLLGTGMLNGTHLGVDFVDGGNLTISPHP